MAGCCCNLTTERLNMSCLWICSQRRSLLSDCGATAFTVKAVPRIESSSAAEFDLRWADGEALRLAIRHYCQADSTATRMAIQSAISMLQHERAKMLVSVFQSVTGLSRLR